MLRHAQTCRGVAARLRYRKRDLAVVYPIDMHLADVSRLKLSYESKNEK